MMLDDDDYYDIVGIGAFGIGCGVEVPTGCIFFRYICFRPWLWLCWRIRSSTPFYSDAVASVLVLLSSPNDRCYPVAFAFALLHCY